MSKLGDFDVSQLMLMLHGELQQAFDASQGVEPVARLRVDRVNVRIGQKGLQQETADPEHLSLLDPVRYPDEENWEINLSYGYGDPIPGHPGGGVWVSSATAGLVLERLKDIPVRKVKGVDRVWNQRLGELGIKTIGNLADCPSEKIRQLCLTYRSLQPLEFRTLVLLLARDFTPLRFSEFYDLSLPDILLSGSDILKSAFRGKMSEPEIIGLKSMAAIICTIIDRTVYRNLKLKILAPAEGS